MSSKMFTRILWDTGDAVAILLCGREIVVGKIMRKDDSVMIRKAARRDVVFQN